MAIGDVYYSERANRFYQVGRPGAVSRDTAVRNLTFDEETGAFIDSRGRTISADLLVTETRTQRNFTAQDASGRTFIKTTVTSKLITEAESQTIRLANNQDITVRTIVTTPDGRTHVYYYSGGLGQNVSAEKLKAEASKKARAALLNTKDAAGNNYKLDSPTVKSRTTRQDISVRTIGVRQGI